MSGIGGFSVGFFLANHAMVPKEISYEAQQAKKRPKDFKELSSKEQWEIDKSLGILDWDGS